VPRRLAKRTARPATFPTGPQDSPAAHMAASLRPHGLHPIRVAAWHLELLFGGPGRVETPRPGPEKLGAVRTDRDLIGLLLTLIWRATRRRQERAQSLTCENASVARKGGRLHDKGYTPALNLQHGQKTSPEITLKITLFAASPPPLQ
jgi:hypothetical protein